MSNPEKIHIGVESEETQGHDTVVSEHAVAHARSLLTSWRSRFTGMELVAKEYSTPEGAHILVRSPSTDTVHLEYTGADGHHTTYDFDASAENLAVEMAEELPGGYDNLLAYDTFSRLLFDCDKRELLG